MLAKMRQLGQKSTPEQVSGLRCRTVASMAAAYPCFACSNAAVMLLCVFAAFVVTVSLKRLHWLRVCNRGCSSVASRI